jgi:hypothetical protein
MRIWTIHPKYLDTKGLVALWRETLLAKNVLEGNTKGYKNHPQLLRFKESSDPLNNINYYLSEVFSEARNRGYNFDRQKIDWSFSKQSISVTDGQVEYEKKHLLNKLQKRDPERYEVFKQMTFVEIHPLFNIVKGDVEKWEIY